MLKHYLLTTLRQLWKRRLYSAISLLSLIVGLTTFCLIVLNVRHELSFNTHWTDASQVYRMTHKQGGTNASLPYTPGFSSQFLLNIHTYVDDYVSSYAEISTFPTSIKDSTSEQPFQVTLADQGFLGVFDLPVMAGSLENVVEGSGFIALDQELAELLFGSAEGAMGKSLTLEGALAFSTNPGFMPSQATDFEVAAVFGLPEPVTRATQFQAVVANNDYSANLLPGFNGTRNRNLTVWMKLPPGMDPETVNTQLDRYLDEFLITTRGPTELRGGSYSDLFDFRLQPLSDIYFNQSIGEVPQGDTNRLWTFGVVALLVLMAGGSNVISLGLASAMERRREVGIRKAVGALQQNIMTQSLGEAVVLSLLALIPTILLVELLHPAFADVKGLATATIDFQLLQTRNDIGEVLANQLATIPGISAVSPLLVEPLISRTTATMQFVNTQQDIEGVPTKNMPFKAGLFDLLGIPRLAGRDFDPASDVMPPPDPQRTEQPVRRVMINRSAVRALGFSELEAVIGQRYYLLQDTGARRSYEPVEVIGVVEDAMVITLRERPGAEFYYFDPFQGSSVLFRYDEAVEADIVARVNEAAIDVTGSGVRISFLEDRITQTFTEEQRESRLLLVCAGLALFLSCVGLYGLVSVALKTQVKEIGVRKVLGASTAAVVKTFLARFSTPVLVANVIAWPVAVYAVFEWIQRFPYQLEKMWLLPICLATTALVLVIAWGTVGVLTLRAASAPPVKSLRYE